MPVTTEMLDRAEPIEVDSVEMPVLAATDLVTSKWLAMDEHYCDFAQMFPIARALREQVAWHEVAQRTRGNVSRARSCRALATSTSCRTPRRLCSWRSEIDRDVLGGEVLLDALAAALATET
jgi:hypothetical protein